MKEVSKTELALQSLKENRAQLESQLTDLETELTFCYLPGKMKDNLINSLIDAIEVLNEEIVQLEEQIVFQNINQSLGLQK